MFTKVINLFNRINDRFTYRQRFVFFSMVFILTTPFPGYWLLKVENFFINRSQWQLVGTEYQQLIDNLIYTVHKHRIVANTQDNYLKQNSSKGLGSLQSSINQQLQKLQKLNVDTEYLVKPSLGRGFSETSTEALDLKKINASWEGVTKGALSATNATSSSELMLIEQLQELLHSINGTFQLVVAPTKTQHYLIESTSETLPEAQGLITNLLLIQQQLLENPSKELILKRAVLTRKLKLNRQKTQQILEYAYNHFSDEISSRQASLSTAKEAYTDYITTVNTFLTELVLNKNAPFSTANRALEANKATIDSNLELTDLLIKNQLSWFRIAKNFSLGIYIFVALTLTFYIIFRVLTRHLMEICYHLREMTRGNFKECFCSHFNDEFGLIGRTFDKMGRSIQGVLGELKNLGNQLSGSIEQITATAKAQEESVSEQEKRVHEIEETAKVIATETRNLANAMSNLSTESVETSVADTAKEGLDRMQSKMSQLATVSTEIIGSLSGLQEKVSSSSTLIAFMGKVSDQASLLSLNSAIETSNIKSHKINFDKITQEIQRFAEKTAASTHEIKEIIGEINSSVVNVRHEANGCLQEINEGAQRLINVSNQLSSITNQGKEQLKKFENVNDVMQMQAIAAENIIYSITSLGETAQENTRSIHVLHENVGELGRTAAELQKTIGLFVS